MKTSSNRLRIGTVLSLFLIIAVLTSSTAVASAAPAAPANGGMISGWVSSQGGFPLPVGTVVKLFEPDEQTVRGQAIPDADDGEFQLGPVPNGMYVLKAVPLPTSGYTQSLPRVFSVVNAPVNLGEVALTEPQVLGTVYGPDGLTPAAAEVLVYLGDGQVLQKALAPDGIFQMGGLPVGGYALQAFPVGNVAYWRSARQAINIVDPAAVQSVSLTLQEAQLWGYAQDEMGNPVREARVTAANGSGDRFSDLSNATGFWAIGGLADGNYSLGALPPWANSGLLPPEPVAISLPGAANPYTLVFGTPPKQVQGFVMTNTGLPVFHAQILARRVNLPGQAQALSEADGTYQLNLAPGLWALTVKPITDTLPLNWVYPESPQLVYFLENNDPETRTQNFTVLTADALVSGIVDMPDGSTPPFTVTVGLYNDEGIGRRVQIDPVDGAFEVSLPNGGYKVMVHPYDPGYLGPVVEPIVLPPEGVLDLGVLTLLQRDAVISGTITSEGAGVASIPIIAWRPGVPGSLRTVSAADGQYALAVSEGTWYIQPAPMSDQPYLFTGAGVQVEILAGGSVEEVDFDLIATDAIITGVLVDEAGEPVGDAHGWGAASQVGSPGIHNGAPIDHGVFTIQVPAGLYRVLAYLPAGSPYTSSAERQVLVGHGENVEVRLPVEVKNAKIVGALWDPRNQDVVEGVNGLVGAWSGDNWVATPINESNGSYAMGVSAGLWHLNFRIDPDAGYAKITGPVNVPVQAGDIVGLPLGVLPKDAEIQGTVVAPDGSPLAGARVMARGVSSPVKDVWFQADIEEDGSFSLAVPHGRYRLGATIHQPDWIRPAELNVIVPPDSISSGHVLMFRLPDATVSGTLTVSNTLIGGEVQVWAWSEDGGFTKAAYPVTLSGSTASGPYELGVISNTVWHLGAIFETESEYWYGRVDVAMGAGDTEQDIILEGPYPKPAPVVVTFDASQPQHIALADGTHIFIPAGAMPVTGMVTLRIVPIATLPHQQHANVYRYGYAFLATDVYGQPIEAHFNQDVVITFRYDELELYRMQLAEQWLKPAYYSTTTERWTFPESYVIDTEANRITMQIDHFTDFALTGVYINFIYLPVMVR
ncbi:MAG: carboxypeptidase regulatory-like domain-containing protein [Anaerolineales bacterium]|nr:carboxypeptidase regulatory-like domain-containing protein [Anaerolineales bacterium]